LMGSKRIRALLINAHQKWGKKAGAIKETVFGKEAKSEEKGRGPPSGKG